jgi:hypothetical protein
MSLSSLKSTSKCENKMHSFEIDLYCRLLVSFQQALMIVSATAEDRRGDPFGAFDGTGYGVAAVPNGTVGFATTYRGFVQFRIDEYNISDPVHHSQNGLPYIDLAIDASAAPDVVVYLMNASSLVSSDLSVNELLSSMMPLQRVIVRESSVLVIGFNGIGFLYNSKSDFETKLSSEFYSHCDANS